MRGAVLTDSNLSEAEMVFTNFRGADLRRADVSDSDLSQADLTGADLGDIHGWQSISSISQAMLSGVKNAPPGFLDWAKQHGAMVNAQPDDVTVSAAISLKEVLTEIDEQYKQDTGNVVDLNLGASGLLAAQIQQGAPVDLFISAANKQVDQLIQLGLADAATRTIVAGNDLVLIVPKDQANPPAKIEDLSDPRFQHIAVGEPKNVPAGQYGMQVLKFYHLDDLLKPRLVMGENVRQVLVYVSRGEADAGLVYATDAKAMADSVKVALVAPPESHEPIVYPAVAIKSGNAQNAAAYLKYLQTDKAKAIFLAHGFVDAASATPSTVK
jgi:molybdate transport system substrate-binding protein